MKILKIVLLCWLWIGSLRAQISHRYTDSLFVAEQIHENLVYATAPELNTFYTGESGTHQTELKMHIFQPQDDELQKRPLLLCAHGGGFVSGNKEHEDMMEFCNIFAQMGYVTATMQYRLGMNVSSQVSAERAVYRAVQDSRAAIRYLREHADELGIDTSAVYFLGSSAGAFAGLHNVFMSTAEERPASTFKIDYSFPSLDEGPDLSGYDAIASQYVQNAQPNALVALWGAIKTPELIQPGDKEIPIFLVHGTSDLIVPFGIGRPFQSPFLPKTYGSEPISERMTVLNYPHKTYFVEGEGHEFYGVTNGNWYGEPNEYWGIVVEQTTEFLHQQHKPAAEFTYKVDGRSVQFNDKSTGNIQSWYWDFGDGTTSTQQNPIHEYEGTGSVQVQLTVQNELESWDSKSQQIDLTCTYINSAETNLPEEPTLYPCYPNPFNPQTTVSFSLEKLAWVNLTVFDVLGRPIKTLLDGNKQQGLHKFVWNGMNENNVIAPSAVYFIRMQSGDFSTSQKVLLVE